MKKATFYVTLPLIIVACVALLAALPLLVAITFDLLPRGNNGLGLALLMAAGVFFGQIIVVLGEIVVLGSGLVWLIRRRKMRLRAHGAHAAAIPAAISAGQPGGTPEPPALPGFAECVRW